MSQPPNAEPTPERWPLSPLPFNPLVSTQRAALLWLLLLGLLTLKLTRWQEVPWYDLDAFFYSDVALNVRDGLGLTTYYSLYNKGFTYFPHPTSIYPLWPLTLGLASRVMDFELACWLLPTLFSIGALGLAYRLVVRLYSAPLLPNLWPVFDAGHLFVLMLGTAKHFYLHTSLPYTEGMAFFFLFFCLLRARSFFEAPTPRAGIELGLWLAVLMMIRSQLFLVTLAAGGALAFATAFMGWRRFVVPAAAVAVGFALGLAPWFTWLSSFAEGVRFGWLLRFDAYQETTHLPLIPFMQPTSGVFDYLADRAQGFPVAFSGYGRFSYYRNFNVLYFGFVVAVPLLLWEALASRARWPQLKAWLRDPGHAGAVFFALLALGGWLSLHTLHKQYFHEWNFATRHGLTAVFIFFAALVYLSARPVLPRLYVTCLIIVGLYLGAAEVGGMGLWRWDPQAQLTTRRPELVAWIQANQKQGAPLVLAADVGRELQPFTRGTAWHWIYKTTTLQQVDALFGPLHTDYLLVDRERRYPFEGRAFELRYERVADDLDGIDVYRPRTAAGAP